MDQPSINCRICKKITPHTVVKVADSLPPDTHVLECDSCGVLGVMRFRQDIEA